MAQISATHTLRSPTGLDDGARKALLRVVTDAGIWGIDIVDAFLRAGAFGDLDDYMDAVAEVWGKGPAGNLRYVLSGRQYEPEQFLLAMPEPDFLTAIEACVERMNALQKTPAQEEISRICRQRGLPFLMQNGPPFHFVWTGDATIHEQAVAPALSTLDDPRLKGGPRTEFNSARQELRAGTPPARKQAVAEACNAVESAMKVVCDELGISLPAPATAQNLFNALKGGGVLVEECEAIVLGPSRFGNRRGRHGAGPVAHDVDQDEAEAVVAAAAVAITLLGRHLP